MSTFPKKLCSWERLQTPFLFSYSHHSVSTQLPNVTRLESHTTPQDLQMGTLQHERQSYLVSTIKPISSLETCSWNLCSSVWWYKLNMKSKTVSLRRTLWLTSVHSMMLFSYWRMEVVKPGQITNLSNRTGPWSDLKTYLDKCGMDQVVFTFID